MRRLALLLVALPVYAIGYVLLTDGADGQYRLAGHVLGGRAVLVAAWAIALVLVVLSHSIRVDLLGKRRVISPGATFVAIGSLLMVLTLVSTSGSMLDWLRFG
jgi:hypothetical protein